MGRPQRQTPRPQGTNRREFFKRSGSAAMVLAAGPALPIGNALATPHTGKLFQHGVASGDPLADRVILWTRVSTPRSR